MGQIDTQTMRIWDAVEKTDPKYLKKISFGKRSFHTIDAQSQIMAATKLFGPIGSGWGYKPTFKLEDGASSRVVVCYIVLWYKDPKTTDITSLCELSAVGTSSFVKNDKVDEDAFKKAETDAVTKGLSRLGFNADVFLGRFDDNRYMDQRTKEVAQEEEAEDKEKSKAAMDAIFSHDGYGQWAKNIHEAIGLAETRISLDELFSGAKKNLSDVAAQSKTHASVIQNWFRAKGSTFVAQEAKP
ncbi:MAG: hypothetical protein JKY34_08655 [Kordiimonadaceae bacterium]|nr:hypothetical protein [Kordiimonadaceae bacterium]